MNKRIINELRIQKKTYYKKELLLVMMISLKLKVNCGVSHFILLKSNTFVLLTFQDTLFDANQSETFF